jgi:hypothetical protein
MIRSLPQQSLEKELATPCAISTCSDQKAEEKLLSTEWMKCNYAHTKASILSSTLRIILTSKTSRCVQDKVAARKGIMKAPVGAYYS